jgi:hypothetical protein
LFDGVTKVLLETKTGQKAAQEVAAKAFESAVSQSHVELMRQCLMITSQPINTANHINTAEHNQTTTASQNTAK